MWPVRRMKLAEPWRVLRLGTREAVADECGYVRQLNVF
jgi:hypothetical protein